MKDYDEHQGRWRSLEDGNPSAEFLSMIDDLIYGRGQTASGLFGKSRATTYYNMRHRPLTRLDHRLRIWLQALGYSEIKIDIQVR